VRTGDDTVLVVLPAKLVELSASEEHAARACLAQLLARGVSAAHHVTGPRHTKSTSRASNA
jgi:hypothetical protein